MNDRETVQWVKRWNPFLILLLLCYVMLCYVMSCYVMLCYVMLCYVVVCIRPTRDDWSISLSTIWRSCGRQQQEERSIDYIDDGNQTIHTESSSVGGLYCERLLYLWDLSTFTVPVVCTSPEFVGLPESQTALSLSLIPPPM